MKVAPVWAQTMSRCFAAVTVALMVSACGVWADRNDIVPTGAESGEALEAEVSSSETTLAENSDVEEDEGENPTLTFGRAVTADEVAEMLAEENGRENVVAAMVATSTLTGAEADCVITNLSYETFVVIANAEQPTSAQRAELLTALDICGVTTQ